MTDHPKSPEGLLACPGEAVVKVVSGRRMVGVDASIGALVAALNDAGFETVASCSGHGFRPGDIALRDGRELIIARDFDEARRINDLFPLDINGDARPSPEPVGYEGVARLFHETYERLAPSFGYKTREASAVPWDGVPGNNKRLMIAVCGEVLAALGLGGRDK